MTSRTPPPAVAETVLGLLALDEVEQDLYCAPPAVEEPFPLYGGQVAAQALYAAGRTVPPGREPHSLHGYFLRGGVAGTPIAFRVSRDRDGRSYSARRVTATQDGEVIFTLSASFVTDEPGATREVQPAPVVPPPEELPEAVLPRLLSIEAKLPQQPDPDVEWPTRFWARCTVDLPDDPLTHACVLTYLSDISSGLFPLHDENNATGASLDHAVWFHRPVRFDGWLLTDLVPKAAGRGRGWYTGTVHAPDGELVASIAQEALFRGRRDIG
ncbi:thioesterase family protein [Amycolatopsis acidiphila]|uniref:Acyl-CoA thioesterase II n=1 Tax=Amycolatopsis acidiphila TaxID=715473 RepID=A0A558ALF4_9PSEU|nr:acyl-CoA thioesterase domain-containing protein [Amycolatopsis acidiphila]TVT25096.1 acyl-CoA thioesterase II [Amycolatopsis acidiphila]UIJ57392.1 thioesterase family protein [Amycolatopsis acidiphila]